MVSLYATFTVFCFVAPPITNKLGPRRTMFVGVLGYGALVLTSLLRLLNVVGGWGVIVGGVANGVGSALLWTAQGRLMLQYSDEHNKGLVFAIFWSLFNVSAVLGGIMLFAYFSSTDSKGNWVLFTIFLCLIGAGACSTMLLLPPEKVR